MFFLNASLTSPLSDQQVFDLPHELKIKIFRFLPVKTLAISQLVSPIWRTFINTYFPKEIGSHQFCSILQNYPIADRGYKNHFLQFAVRQIVANDFEKALELEKNLESCPSIMIERALDDFVKYADSKEKILKIFDLF